MKKLLATLAVVGFTVPAMAQAVDFDSVDADGSGTVSWEEVQTALPEITEEEFQAADIDSTGELTEEQFEVLAGAGDMDAAPMDDTMGDEAPADDEMAPIE